MHEKTLAQHPSIKTRESIQARSSFQKCEQVLHSELEKEKRHVVMNHKCELCLWLEVTLASLYETTLALKPLKVSPNITSP